MSCATNVYSLGSLGAVAPTTVGSRAKLGMLNEVIVLTIDLIRKVGEMRRAGHLIRLDDGQ